MWESNCTISLTLSDLEWSFDLFSRDVKLDELYLRQEQSYVTVWQMLS